MGYVTEFSLLAGGFTYSTCQWVILNNPVCHTVSGPGGDTLSLLPPFSLNNCLLDDWLSFGHYLDAEGIV
jgi:hypothetical protein